MTCWYKNFCNLIHFGAVAPLEISEFVKNFLELNYSSICVPIFVGISRNLKFYGNVCHGNVCQGSMSFTGSVSGAANASAGASGSAANPSVARSVSFSLEEVMIDELGRAESRRSRASLRDVEEEEGEMVVVVVLVV